MSVQLMSEVNNNYHMAVAAHRELADTFWFICLPGYALWNEYQYLDEGMTQRKVKRYITSTYHVLTPDKLPKSANITEPLLSGKNRKTLKPGEGAAVAKEAFRIYQEWEESTLQAYQQVARELMANGDTAAFNFVGEIIKDVKAELVYVTDKIIELNAHDWDMPQIVSEQADYFERYSHLIGKMFSDSKKMQNLHHWNAALDQESRVVDSYV